MSGEIERRRSLVEKTQWNNEQQYVCDMMNDDGSADLGRPSGARITQSLRPRAASALRTPPWAILVCSLREQSIADLEKARGVLGQNVNKRQRRFRSPKGVSRMFA